MILDDSIPEMVARDDSSRLRIRARDRVTNAPMDLTGQTVLLRWVLGSGATEERTMTVVTPQSNPVNTGRADYTFLPTDVLTGGFLSYEVRLIDNLSRTLTSVNTENIRVKEPLAVVAP